MLSEFTKEYTMNKTVWAIVIGGVALAILVVGVSLLIPLAVGSRYDPGWGGMWHWMMGGFPFGGGIVTLLFLILVIGAIVWLVQTLARGARQPGTGTPSSESPLDILKRRYAKGEITKEQFEEMKRDLG
jgi:putative membrane protein